LTVDESFKRAKARRNRESDVIEAAIAVFYAKGYSAATIQDVADAVGVLKGSLYHYISTKEQLLHKVLRGSHEQAQAIMAQVSELDAPPLERLQTYLRLIHLWYLEHPERVSVYFNQQHHLTGESYAEMRMQNREFELFLRGLLSEAKRTGALADDVDPKLATFFILGALNSLPRWYQPGGPLSRERVAEEFSLMATRMLLPGSGATR
jgi:AcrR family transcriptional regulator